MLILAVIAVCSFFGARLISAVGEPNGPYPEENQLAQQRTDPVYRVVTDASAIKQVAATGGAAASGGSMSGKEVFHAVCHTCHIPGVLGAPKITDTAEWTKRFSEQGLKSLYKNAIDGIGNMPPKGGKASLTTEEMHAAVNYILNKAGVEGAPALSTGKKASGTDTAASGQATTDETASADAKADTGEATTKTASKDDAAASEQAGGSDSAAGEKVAAASGAAIDAKTANTVGKKVFKALCHTCHVPGIAGAPKVTDGAEWKKRLAAQGLDKVHYNAIHGLGAMPPKGGNASLSDDEVIAAVNYMLLKSGAK